MRLLWAERSLGFQRGWVLALLALLAGYAQAVSIAAPWSGQPLWWLQILSMAALVMLLNACATARQAGLLGWLFATSWLCGTVWWLFISMHVYGGLAAPLAVLAVLALCGFMASFYAATAYFYKHFRALAPESIGRSAMIFAALWLLAELIRDSWFSGFPWGAGGYAHADGPLSGFAQWLGVYGIGFLASVIAHWAVEPLRQSFANVIIRRFSYVILIGVLFGAGKWLQGAESTQPVAQSKVLLLQGNIPQGEKFDARTGVKESLEWYQSQLQQSSAPLIITPETAIPVLLSQLPEGYWASISERFRRGDQAALIGLPLGDFDQGYTNSVLGLKPAQTQAYQYDKHHLVPFGEFIPPLFKWFTQMMNIPLGDFNRGAVGQPSFEWAGQRWAPNICYEDLFGDELARRFVDEKTAPTVMVNVSNIGWFGNSIAIDQHLQISRMRALELGRPMVRATNTGATVIINHRGEVTHSLPRHTKGVLQGEVLGRQGFTPYVQWAGRYGLLPLWGLAIAIIIVATTSMFTGARGSKRS